MINQSTPIISHISARIKLKTFDQESLFVHTFTDNVCQKLQLTIVKKTDHVFTPYGLTLVYLLSQSHIAIHTWPEFNVLHVDLVSCRIIEKDEFDSVIQNELKPFGIEEYNSELHSV